MYRVVNRYWRYQNWSRWCMPVPSKTKITKKEEGRGSSKEGDKGVRRRETCAGQRNVHRMCRVCHKILCHATVLYAVFSTQETIKLTRTHIEHVHQVNGLLLYTYSVACYLLTMGNATSRDLSGHHIHIQTYTLVHTRSFRLSLYPTLFHLLPCAAQRQINCLFYS